MTFAVGPATDWLVTQARTATTGVTVNGQPMLVSDGWPDELTFGMFIVGLSDPPPDGMGSTTSTMTRATMGAFLSTGEHTIPFCIDIRESGTSAKDVRDEAEAVLNAFWPLIEADPSLGGALPAGSVVGLSVTSTPHNVGTVAEPGRRHLISGAIRCTDFTA